MKSKTWICIAWKKDSNESVCKKAQFEKPVSKEKMLTTFKRTFPELRNHTVQTKD